MGICLQHNDCLFPELTIRETIQFFLRLKTMGRYDHNDEAIEQILREVSLHDRGDILVKNLSGGMKRKLCVAIAFCGDSQVVILDEPTSGMVSHPCSSTLVTTPTHILYWLVLNTACRQDPFSRRSIWNIIKKKQEGRIILFTTHFLVSSTACESGQTIVGLTILV